MKKSLRLVLTFIAAILCLQVVQAVEPSDLLGTWMNGSVAGETREFKPAGVLIVKSGSDTMTGKYEVKGDSLTSTFEGISETAKITVKGGEMVETTKDPASGAEVVTKWTKKK